MRKPLDPNTTTHTSTPIGGAGAYNPSSGKGGDVITPIIHIVAIVEDR